MFNPADAPSPKGWSKRRANAQAKLDQKNRMAGVRAARELHYAAQRAGFANAEEHAAHLAAAAEPAQPVVATDAPVEPAATEGPAEAPEVAAEPASATDAPVTPPATETPVEGAETAAVSEPEPKAKGRKKAQAEGEAA